MPSVVGDEADVAPAAVVDRDVDVADGLLVMLWQDWCSYAAVKCDVPVGAAVRGTRTGKELGQLA